MMQTSPAGVAAIRSREGCRLKIYLDQAGRPTIGVGHLIQPDEGDKYDAGISEDQAEILLATDLGPAEEAVRTGIEVPLSQEKFDSLVSFVFNVGILAFMTSTLRKAINSELADGLVAAQFARWTKVRDPATRELVESEGLRKRREQEAAPWVREPEEAPAA
jgi:lysozyme